jgi:chromosome segregation ATPase
MGKNKNKNKQQSQNVADIQQPIPRPEVSQTHNNVVPSISSTLQVPTQHHITIPMISMQEYEKLVNERNELNKIMLELNKDYNSSRETNKQHEETIKMHEQTIKALQQEIIELKQEIIELKQINKHAMNKIDNIEKKNAEIKKENAEIKSEMNDIKRQQEIKKLRIAIQGCSKELNLRSSLNSADLQAINDLNDGRVDNCHFINKKKCSTIDIQNKLIFMYNKINKLQTNDVELHDEFDLLHLNVLNIMLNNLPSGTISQQIERKINIEWKYM